MKSFEIIRLIICIICLFVTENSVFSNDDLIVVNKKNVEYRFVKFDEKTDHFTKHTFLNWKNETFDVFDQVKNRQTIAIDLGAWIGGTSIWLSKNFHAVIAVENDAKSLDCLQRNLLASGCPNVLICKRPVSRTSKSIVLKTKRETDDEFISQQSSYDEVRPITFKQLIHDYVFANGSINGYRISFINCDIHGGEEDILEDVLHFAYNNHCSVHVTFHLDLWKNQTISDYDYLFRYFKTNCPHESISAYLLANPNASILFERSNDWGPLIKKNMPVFVIGFNQPAFIKNMVKQLEQYTSDISIIDNNSDFPSLLDYYANDYPYTLLRQGVNHGHKVYQRDFIQRLTGDLYVLTDPDLQFNTNLPSSFLEDFVALSNAYAASKVGFALLIDADDIRTDLLYQGRSIQEWEKVFWVNRLYYPSKPHMELYSAPIDTTFCLVNRRFSNNDIRVAGDYTCKHIPFHKNFENMLEPGEYEHYKKSNKSSSWIN